LDGQIQGELKPNRPSLFEELGGEAKLRAIIDVFIDRVFEDRMIGFFFRNAERGRIKEFEYQHAAAFLGAPVVYRGRALDQAHAKHPIMGGHFARRRQILKETLEAYTVPDAVKRAWLEHTDSLRPLITSQSGSDCDPIAAREKVQSSGSNG
jgi:hemoglobin